MAKIWRGFIRDLRYWHRNIINYWSRYFINWWQPHIVILCFCESLFNSLCPDWVFHETGGQCCLLKQQTESWNRTVYIKHSVLRQTCFSYFHYHNMKYWLEEFRSLILSIDTKLPYRICCLFFRLGLAT